MSFTFYKDLSDFLECLNNEKVEYMVVGGYAVILHGYNRTTGDLDIWVKNSKENYDKLVKSLYRFGIPGDLVPFEQFINNQYTDVFTFGRAPLAIDIMTQVKGLEFDQAYKNVKKINIDKKTVNIIDYRELIMAKKAANRFKDLNDIQQLNIVNKKNKSDKEPLI